MGTSLKTPSVQIYVVFVIVYLADCFYIFYARIVSCFSYSLMLDEYSKVLVNPIKAILEWS